MNYGDSNRIECGYARWPKNSVTVTVISKVIRGLMVQEAMLPGWLQEGIDRHDQPEEVLKFAASFLSAPREEQDAVVESWDSTIAWNWPDPMRLACASEQPGTTEERITADLLLRALAYASDDWRDAIVGFAINYNSCILADVDADQIFQRVAFAVGGRAKRALLSFLRREPQNKTMRAFLLTAITDPGGGFEIKHEKWIKKSQ